MMLANSLFTEPIPLNEDAVSVIAIENPIAFRNCVFDLLEQCRGGKGEYVFSENYEPIEFYKRGEFVTDAFGIEIGGKRISNQINAEATRILENYADEYNRIAREINELAFRVVSELDFEADFNRVEDPSKIIKLIDIFVDTADMSFCEKLLEYMRLCRKHLKKDIFVFLHLRSCMSIEEREAFYKSVQYEKFVVLFVEDHITPPVSAQERIMIVDSDLCVI